MQTELLENTNIIGTNCDIVEEEKSEISTDIKSIISKYKEQIVVTIKSDKKIKLV